MRVESYCPYMYTGNEVHVGVVIGSELLMGGVIKLLQEMSCMWVESYDT